MGVATVLAEHVPQRRCERQMPRQPNHLHTEHSVTSEGQLVPKTLHYRCVIVSSRFIELLTAATAEVILPAYLERSGEEVCVFVFVFPFVTTDRIVTV